MLRTDRVRARRALPVLVLLPLACALLAALTAEARADTITVQVTQIRASNDGEPYMDPELEPLREQLEQYRYKRFEIAGRESKSCEGGDRLTFPLLGGLRLVTVQREHKEKSKVEIDCKVRDPAADDRQVASTRAIMLSGATLLLALPPKERERLFLAVTVRRTAD